MKKMILSMFVLMTVTGYTQERISREQLIDDCNAYLQYLEGTHPDPYTGFGGLVEFKRAAQDMRNSITEETTIEQFHRLLSSFVAVLGDGHSMINILNEQENVKAPVSFLPVRLKTATDGLFISRTTAAYQQYKGAKIIAINGLSVDETLEKAKKVQPTENKYGAYQALCLLIADNKNAALLFGSSGKNIRFSLQTVEGSLHEVDMAWLENPEWMSFRSTLKFKNENPLLHGQLIEKEKKTVGYFAWNNMSAREIMEETAQNPNPQYLETNLNVMYTHTLKIPRPKDDKAAIRKIPSLYATFTELLKTMKSGKTEYLIIDLRENGGGMTPLCRPLLYMLYGDKYLNFECKVEYNRRLSSLILQKWGLDSIAQYNRGNNTHYRLGDFTFGYFFGTHDARPAEEKRKDLSLISYFRNIGSEYTKELNGKPLYEPRVVVLTSPKTFSAAYHFMYLLTQIGDAKVVGVPSQQAGNTFMETTYFELPNTHITGSISNSIQVFFPDDSIKGKAFMPDYPMNWSDYANYDFDENAEILYALDMLY
jgi:hypothetical protein